MEITTYKLRVTLTEPVLGTQPQKDVASEYITTKFEKRVEKAGIPTSDAGLPEDELGTLTEELERGTTVFHKLNDKPIFYDYHIKGFIKESGKVQNGMDGVKALRSKVDNYVFPFPRRIEIHLPEEGKVEFLERPLRAMTAQGERVSLARSEMLPVGSWLECEIRVIGKAITEKMLRELLDYGAFKGLGQWRNGGFGRFEYTLDKV